MSKQSKNQKISYLKKKKEETIKMYPALLESGVWINPDGTKEIRKMTKSHIENTKNMLIEKPSGLNEFLKLNRILEEDATMEEIEHIEGIEHLEEIIELLTEKIEEFEWHLENDRHDEYY